ncbi:MAG TPA: PaaI family thioesterase [Dehalococcoidia bacterium]|nr:PaaI family thioesterase [Dehalococcoidia bacterium]
MADEKDKINDNVSWLREQSEAEPIASFLKMELAELSEGYAKVTMKITEDYQNFHGVTFGGIIMALADQAFAYASNSLVYPSVASHFSTYFIAGARMGDELTAECRVIKSGKRAGFSEVTITNQEGRLIARATGVTIPLNQQ